MKRLLTILSFILLIFPASAQINNSLTAVFYNSGDAYSIAAAAVVPQKYGNVNYYDTRGLDSAGGIQMIQAITDSLYRVYVMVDTPVVWTSGALKSTWLDTISLMFKVLNGEDAAPISIEPYDSVSRPEVAWASIFSGYTAPVAIKYLGHNIFSYERGVFASSASSDSTLIFPLSRWNADTFNNKVVYITKGTDAGQKVTISDTKEDTLILATKFTAALDSTSEFTIRTSTVEDFYDIYMRLVVETDLYDLSDVQTRALWEKLYDNTRTLATQRRKVPNQDLTYLAQIIVVGHNIFNYTKR